MSLCVAKRERNVPQSLISIHTHQTPSLITMTAVPDGAACYFCLGEEADEEGMPFVRDCSCRGDSAGFAHLSCLTKYAEQKSKQASERDMAAFTEPWKICNNCKQLFQGQLSIDLTSAGVSFAEATYSHEGNSKYDKMKVLSAIKSNIIAHKTGDRTETTVLINKLLSIIDQTKKDLKMSRWINMPRDSEEYKYCKSLCGNYEAYLYEMLGIMLGMASFTGDSSEEGIKVAIGHLKKARAIYNLFGMKDKVKLLDSQISALTAMLKETKVDEFAGECHSFFQVMKNSFENDLKTHGMNSADTIHSGLNYTTMLLPTYRHIEAERLATKVATASCRIHGPGHKTTCEAEMFLNKCKERHVRVLPDDKSFQALRYENEGEICVITGPITKPRKVEDETLHHIANNLVIPKRGCVVICHGLISASHLNGELGEVRDVKKSGTGIRLAVHFEKKGEKSALVKLENLRIAFELPISSEE